MRNLLTLAAATAILAAGSGFSAQAQPGAYRGGQPQGAPQAASGPQLGPGGIPAGSYQQSCRNEQVQPGGWMTAECRASDGRWAFSHLPYSQCRTDIQTNQTGILMCGSIVADSGRFVDAGNDRRDDRRDERRDDRAAAAVVGAVAGALFGPPPPPVGIAPAPQGRDWRYERGGWAYGHRPGEWVPIRDRASWIDTRLDRAQRDGRLGRRDARDLRRQLDDIVTQEDRYLRDGRLGGREREDLQRRFDDLERRIDYEAGPGGRPRDRDRDYDRR